MDDHYPLISMKCYKSIKMIYSGSNQEIKSLQLLDGESKLMLLCYNRDSINPFNSLLKVLNSNDCPSCKTILLQMLLWKMKNRELKF